MFKTAGLVCVLALIFQSSNAMAENNNFIFNGAPLHVITNTNKDFILSNYQQFIDLRQSGEKIKIYGELPAPEYRDAKETLFHCYLDYYTRQHGFTAVKTPGPSLSAILHHFPATTALAMSDEELERIKKNFAGKTIFDYTPDLKKQTGNRFISTQSETGYYYPNNYSFVNKDGEKLSIVSIVSYVTHGSLLATDNYAIKSPQGKIWVVEKLDENSPL